MRKITILISILLTILINLMSFSQPVQQEWVRTIDQYNGGPSDAVMDTSGNVYISGGITYSGQGNNYITVKYNTNGVQQWLVFYNGPGSNSTDIATAMVIDLFGNVYVTGYSDRGGLQTWDYCTIKYNSSGVQQWVSRYSGPTNGQNRPYDIAVDDSGFVYVTGSSTGIGTGLDYCTIKYNNNGDSLWVRRYNGGGYLQNDDGASSIYIDVLGNVFVTGTIRDYNSFQDCCTIKYNNSGIQQWVNITNISGANTYGSKIRIASDNNIYIGGVILRTNFDYLVLKLNSNGIQQWFRTYNGPGNNNDALNDLCIDNLSSIYVTGTCYVGPGQNDDYCTIKYNTNGDSLWVRRYDGPANSYDHAYSIALDNQANAYVTGGSTTITGDSGFCTIKYNTDGVQQWLIRSSGVSGEGDKVLVDKYNNIYVVGRQNINFNAIITTIKYSQPNGIKNISNDIPKKFKLLQNYPNPFNPSSKIKFQIAKLGDVRLNVYDVLGREVATLVNESAADGLKPGTYEVEFDGSKLSSGVYFYKLVTNDFTETKKMVVVK